jgi:hypothetical protein
MMRWNKTLWLGLLLPALAMGSALAQNKAAGTGKKAAPAASASASAAAPAPAVASAVAGSPAPAGSAKPAGLDGATYSVRLRDLEQRIDELKEQIRRSHTRLSLLTDTILSGGAAGSRSEIQFKNDLSTAFRLVKALFVLDGAVQYNKADDTGALAEQQQIPIFSGSIPPGDHTLQVLLQLQGNGYGVFSYLKGYHFDLRTAHSFTAVDGKTLSLNVVAYEAGGVTTPLEERPKIRFEQKITAGTAQPTTGPAAPAPGNASAPPSGAGFSLSTGGK